MAEALPLLDPAFLKKLESLALVSKKLRRGRNRGERMTYRKGSSLEFADYRSYQPGDDLRYIDWNIWSRLDRLFIKLFAAEEDTTVHLLIDTSASMGFGTPSKLDWAARLAGALGYLAIRRLDRVGVAAFSDGLGAYLRPVRRRDHVFSLFRYLEKMKPSRGTRFSESLSKYLNACDRPGLAVVISDLLDPEGYETGLYSLLYRKFDIILVHIMAEEEISPPARGALELTDSETGLKRRINLDRSLLGSYRRHLKSFLNDAERFALGHRIDYLRVTTDLPVEDAVLRYLRQGAYLI